MGLNKATGDMYGWVDFTHTHLRGECPHKCHYCYARKGRAKRFYEGPLRMEFKELQVGYGNRENKPVTIFEEHMIDLFADGIQKEWQALICGHCQRWPENTYVFQTRNTKNLAAMIGNLPPKRIIGTTCETDRIFKIGTAPDPLFRLQALKALADAGERTFITVEPVMQFYPSFADLLIAARPSFVNIGADSKGCNLVEPSFSEVWSLAETLAKAGVKVNLKPNLKRLAEKEGLIFLPEGLSGMEVTP